MVAMTIKSSFILLRINSIAVTVVSTITIDSAVI